MENAPLGGLQAGEGSRLNQSRSRVQCYCSEIDETNLIIEPPHDKTDKMACAPSEDSDQPGQLLSLIRVFAVRLKKA